MVYIIVAVVVLVVLLIVIRLSSKSGSMVSSARPTKDRRSGQDRRTMNVRVPFERRREHRRMEDAAANFVKELVKVDSA